MGIVHSFLASATTPYPRPLWQIKPRAQEVTKVIANKNFLVLILVISISACKAPESKENSEHKIDEAIDSTLGEISVQTINNKEVNFEYELGETTEFGENFMIDIECLVTNETGEDICYLNQSCNGLDYYLIIRPDSYKVMPLINCNGTWAIISKLAPNDSVKFKTQILQLKDSEPIEKIGLDFRAVDKFIPFDSLRENPEMVDKIYRSETEIDNVIWGNKK